MAHKYSYDDLSKPLGLRTLKCGRNTILISIPTLIVWIFDIPIAKAKIIGLPLSNVPQWIVWFMAGCIILYYGVQFAVMTIADARQFKHGPHSMRQKLEDQRDTGIRSGADERQLRREIGDAMEFHDNELPQMKWSTIRTIVFDVSLPFGLGLIALLAVIHRIIVSNWPQTALEICENLASHTLSNDFQPIHVSRNQPKKVLKRVPGYN